MKEPDAGQHVEVDQIAQADDEQVGIGLIAEAELAHLYAAAGNAKAGDELKIENLVQHLHRRQHPSQEKTKPQQFAFEDALRGFF